MACRPYNTGRCLQLRLFNCPNFGVHFMIRPLKTNKLFRKLTCSIANKYFDDFASFTEFLFVLCFTFLNKCSI